MFNKQQHLLGHADPTIRQIKPTNQFSADQISLVLYAYIIVLWFVLFLKGKKEKKRKDYALTDVVFVPIQDL